MMLPGSRRRSDRRLQALARALRQPPPGQPPLLCTTAAAAAAPAAAATARHQQLKQRIRAGEVITGINVPLRETTTQRQISDAVAAHDVPVDFLFMDGQHSPLNEDTVARICGFAHVLGLPMHLRIKHTQSTHLIGNMCDLGPAIVEVPQVETLETARDAVENFYFRNWQGGTGRRSW
jgi:2-keto-3-deoxy-L-rhamnonate aldolase RhmA